mmetsp:Transcript_96855/g.250492  ORF Transcript_96855/g.250492 Transcript_96855/m.250492 type:complete len:292 (-) Transcript_96855:577-1452(-)
MSEPTIVAQLVQGVKAKQLLDILRRVEVDRIGVLLQNTNIDLVVRLFNGPLEAAVGGVAGHLAGAMMLDPRAAKGVKQLTDALHGGILGLDKAVDKAVRRGAQERSKGGEEGGGQGHVFGDFTRGLFADVADKSKVLADKVIGDITEVKQRMNTGMSMDAVTAGLSVTDIRLQGAQTDYKADTNEVEESRSPAKEDTGPALVVKTAPTGGARGPGLLGDGKAVPMCSPTDMALSDLRPVTAELATTIGKRTGALVDALGALRPKGPSASSSTPDASPPDVVGRGQEALSGA